MCRNTTTATRKRRAMRGDVRFVTRIPASEPQTGDGHAAIGIRGPIDREPWNRGPGPVGPTALQRGEGPNAEAVHLLGPCALRVMKSGARRPRGAAAHRVRAIPRSARPLHPAVPPRCARVPASARVRHRGPPRLVAAPVPARLSGFAHPNPSDPRIGRVPRVSPRLCRSRSRSGSRIGRGELPSNASGRRSPAR
jgi:hypothetical protein